MNDHTRKQSPITVTVDPKLIGEDIPEGVCNRLGWRLSSVLDRLGGTDNFSDFTVTGSSPKLEEGLIANSNRDENDSKLTVAVCPQGSTGSPLYKVEMRTSSGKIGGQRKGLMHFFDSQGIAVERPDEPDGPRSFHQRRPEEFAPRFVV